MKRFTRWSLFTVALAMGCGDKPPPGALFVFNRPEHLELVCFNGDWQGDESEDEALSGKNARVLPLRCCSRITPLSRQAFFPSDKAREELCGERGAAVLHALVTQSARGEVAAVDLQAGKIKDSNRRIPGYTFVDVGGLPAAIITPREIETDQGVTSGAPWTFVASGEDYNVRAIATCRFVSADGVSCGPERDKDFEGLDEEERRKVFEVALPSPPADMVYLDNALWVTLPDLSAIARIDLAPQGDKQHHPFVEKDGRAGPATFFAMPTIDDIDPGAPIKEEDPYLAVCGIEYKPSFNPLQLSPAPLAMSMEAPAPHRLRVDEATGLLLVADRGQPVVHALGLDDGVPSARGVIKTGAPVRDFAVTSPVPATAPSFEELTPKNPPPTFADLDLKRSKNLPQFAEEARRYMYAIDDRDGSLLAMTFGVDDDTGEVAASLLEAPHRLPGGARDRIPLAGNATALDIIDTRALNGEHICNPADQKGLDDLIEQLEDQPESDARTKKKDTLNIAKGLASNASSAFLNGVFVAVVDSVGILTIVDVHDTDMFCRAGLSCTGDGAGETTRSKTSLDPLGVQRHAVRRRAIVQVKGSVSDENALDELDCPEGTFAALKDPGDEGPTRLCANADPWTSLPGTFGVAYEGWFARTIGSLERDDEGQLILRAAAGLDFCARGIVADALDGEGEGYRGDWVVAFATPNPNLEGCAAPTAEREPRMRVLQAFADRLILEDPVTPSGTSGGATKPYDADKLLACFPTSMPVDWRVNDRYLVQWSGGYLHRLIASDGDGACIEDETKDPRLHSRTTPGELFQNPYIAFRLSEPEEDSLPTALDTSIQVTGGSADLAPPVYVGSIGDSMPVVVRYSDVTGELFVVDTSRQGLRRFGLTPLRGDNSGYR
jgi:hypothetical protein